MFYWIFEPTSIRLPDRHATIQGRLKVWTEHSTLILLISIPFEVAQQKFQHFYNLCRNEFSPNLKGEAQKLGLPRPFEVLDVFGGKSKFKAPNAFKFSTKRVPIEVYNWWKFGVDISNHFWVIQIQPKFITCLRPPDVHFVPLDV